MGKILVEFDNNIKQTDIIVPLTNSSPEEAGENYVYNKEEVQQTSIYGILVPLIEINNVVIDFTDVEFFELKSTGHLPVVYMTVRDRYNLTSTIDTPGVDNSLRIQILPQFDNAYKKINMTFYISRININDGEIELTGTYKLSELTSTQYRCLGEMDTYSLFRYVATKTGLGFATNCAEMSDTRFIYCDNKSYNELLADEINIAETDQSHIYDWWVDFWNNLNFVNIWDRYNTIESEEDMMIWVSGQTKEMLEGVKVEPQRVAAVLNNLPSDGQLELHVDEYEQVNSPGTNSSNGTDKIYSCYMENVRDYSDTLMQDGDVKNDVFVKIEYVGEVYGDYNYLLADKLREANMQKMSTESIIVTLKTPLLGLIRGSKVNFVWYNADDQFDARMENYKDAGIINDVQTTPVLDDSIPKDELKYDWDPDEFKKDMSISGQYMVAGQDMIYNEGQWFYDITLIRPLSQKPKILVEENNEENNE